MRQRSEHLPHLRRCLQYQSHRDRHLLVFEAHLFLSCLQWNLICGEQGRPKKSLEKRPTRSQTSASSGSSARFIKLLFSFLFLTASGGGFIRAVASLLLVTESHVLEDEGQSQGSQTNCCSLFIRSSIGIKRWREGELFEHPCRMEIVHKELGIKAS